MLNLYVCLNAYIITKQNQKNLKINNPFYVVELCIWNELRS